MRVVVERIHIGLRAHRRRRLVVAVRVECESKALKPGYRLIGPRVETGRFHATGQLDSTCTQPHLVGRASVQVLLVLLAGYLHGWVSVRVRVSSVGGRVEVASVHREPLGREPG
jgi:hypothetical protein